MKAAVIISLSLVLHPVFSLGLLTTFNLVVGVPLCVGPGEVRSKAPSGVKVRCGCHICVCVCGWDNVAICSMYCMCVCASLLRLHNGLPAGTCGSSSQGTKLLYSSTQPPHTQNQKASTQTHSVDGMRAPLINGLIKKVSQILAIIAACLALPNTT